MRENKATFWKKDKEYTIYATGLPMLQAGLRHLLDISTDFLSDYLFAKDIEYVIDVGANMGFTAMMFHFAWPNAKILAIEPSSFNYDFLIRNTEKIENITPIQCAAGAHETQVQIALPTTDQRGDIKLNLEQYDNTGAISVYGKGDLYKETVQCHRLDDIAEQRVDYLKLDVEGYELEVLKGAHRILSEDRPIIQIEMRPTTQMMAGLSIHDVHRFIQSYGYVRTGVYEGDNVYLYKDLNRGKVAEAKIEKTFKAPNQRLMDTFKYHLKEHDMAFLGVINEFKDVRKIYDVGACIGAMSVLFKNVFPEAKVIAIEPSSENYKFLETNAGFFKNIIPMKCAISNYNGKIRIAMPTKEQRPEMDEESETNPAIISVLGDSDIHSEEVECFTLDTLAKDGADLLKIDAEGHEWEVLDGAEETLKNSRPIVLLNCREGTQRMAGRTVEELLEKMRSYGYKKSGHYKGDAIMVPEEINIPLYHIPDYMKG